MAGVCSAEMACPLKKPVLLSESTLQSAPGFKKCREAESIISWYGMAASEDYGHHERRDDAGQGGIGKRETDGP